MSNTNTGGPAFPAAVVFQDQVIYDGGMTLRDYFAAKAMQAELEGGVHRDAMPSVAQRAYEMADAMLKAREQ